MAQKVITTLVDDLDGTEIKNGKGETVSFSLDGKDYEIDLTTKHADKFRSLFQEYIAVATRASSKTRMHNMRKSNAGGPAPSEIRAWAKGNGFDVPERGRIPADVKDAYAQAH